MRRPFRGDDRQSMFSRMDGRAGGDASRPFCRIYSAVRSTHPSSYAIFGTVALIAVYPEAAFDALYAVHVKGAFLLCKHATSRMRDGGSVIITSSVAGVRGDPSVYGYIVAKHAQIGLMRCLAKELAPRRIRVNTVHPGPIDNSFQQAIAADLADVIKRDGAEFFNAMIPLGRHGTPEEVVQFVLYRASDESRFTTGSRLMIDGGMSA